MTRPGPTAFVVLSLCLALPMAAALVVPTDVQLPGTQPLEVRSLESPDKCDNCHGGYSTTTEPAHNWRGSAMAQATRDPLFWATMAVAEQDFDGAGDFCLRCHSPEGWLAGRSTPTDGSGLSSADANGVSCDLCHKLTNPSNREWVGAQFYPFVANDGASPATGYYGSGMYSVWGGSQKLGPYADAAARHQSGQSRFHRQSEFCGTCHDVSNSVIGDLAHNNGRQPTSDPIVASGVPGAAVTTKAAFRNFPFQYGIVERTFSEHASSALGSTRVSSYASLPDDLKAGAIKAAYESALAAGTGGDYQDGTPRYFTCQTCHVRPITGQGCNKNPAVRSDLPLHDMTGGNYWLADAIRHLNSLGRLRVGGTLTATELAALADGKARALKQLASAASLKVTGNTVRVTNLTGHKLISGYPEGRRMWLNIRWYDANSALLREDGAYGELAVQIDGTPVIVKSLKNLADPHTRIYDAHYAMTREWAAQLLDLGYSPALPLAYDRINGAPVRTLGELAAQSAGTYQETFRFVLNNLVAKDNRIPPFGMSYEAARRRNALPVPNTQYGNPTPAGTYNYWDDVALSPPTGAAWAAISLMYQPTSWEYIQFLYLANNGTNAFLANEGRYLLEAWQSTGMAEPYVMVSTTWGTPPQPTTLTASVDDLSTWAISKGGVLASLRDTFAAGATVAIKAHATAAGQSLSGAQLFIEVRSASGPVASLQAFTDADGWAVAKWTTARKQQAGIYTIRLTQIIKSGYAFDDAASATATVVIQ